MKVKSEKRKVESAAPAVAEGEGGEKHVRIASLRSQL
jgi:hypothetical protein